MNLLNGHNRGAYVVGLWCTPASVVALFASMGLLGHFIPPPPPSLSPQEVVAMYAAHPFGIRITAIMTIVTAALLAPLTGIVSVVLWRSEGKSAPLAMTQLVAGVFTVFPFVITGLCWAVAAFRLDRPADGIVLMNDFAWISLEMVTAPAVVQLATVAYAILLDRSTVPLYPRWLAYYCFWTCLLFLPGAAVAMFHHGPFAWNGILSFWLAAAAYGSWVLTMAFMSLRAVRIDERS